MRAAPQSLVVPSQSPYDLFFKEIERRLSPLGKEMAFSLTNNQAVAADIEGLSFDKAKVSAASISYLIQRVTTSTGATELLETGEYRVVYKPSSAAWSIFQMWTSGPDNSGVVLSITSAGQVQYTSSNITGTASISKITWRADVLAAKHSTYSEVGR